MSDLADEKCKEMLDEAGLSLAAAIGKAKRIFKDSKKVTTYTDELSREEAALFANDTKLASMVATKAAIDMGIIEHIQARLEDYREEKVMLEAEKAKRLAAKEAEKAQKEAAEMNLKGSSEVENEEKPIENKSDEWTMGAANE